MHQIQRDTARTVAIFAILFGMVACGSGIGAPAPTTDAETKTLPGTFTTSSSGVCVQNVTHTRTWSSSPPADPSCSAATFGGRAFAAGVRLLGGIGDVVLTDTGELPPAGGALSETLVDLDLQRLAQADVAKVTTSGSTGRSEASAEVTNVRIHLAGIVITADVLTSRAEGLCTPGGATYSGASILSNLIIDGIRIDVDAAPNRVLEIRGVLRIVLNEQRLDASGFTVAAIHVSVLSLIDAADVVIAKATTFLTCHECSPPGNEDDDDGDGDGDDDDDGPPPIAGDDDDDDHGDDEDSEVCNDEESALPPAGGGPGERCDDGSPCAPGYACAYDRPSVVR